MIRALMVDVDGVIVRGRPGDGRHWSTDLQLDLGLDPALLQQAFFAVHWEAIVLGHAPLRERLADALARVAPTLPADRLIDYWFATDAWLDEHLLAELARVRADGLQVHLVTNQEHERVRYLLDKLRLGEQIDDCHYSAALGCRKPQAAFFHAVARSIGLAPEELLLIDDAEGNVAAAQAAGWQAVRWTEASRLSDVLRQ